MKKCAVIFKNTRIEFRFIFIVYRLDGRNRPCMKEDSSENIDKCSYF